MAASVGETYGGKLPQPFNTQGERLAAAATARWTVEDSDGANKSPVLEGFQFYGERNGGVVDAWGNHWYIATHTEDLTTEELMSRGVSQGESVK